MLTPKERKDIDQTLLYGNPFGGPGEANALSKLQSIDSEARKYHSALELIEALCVDGTSTADSLWALRRIQQECAKALRNETVGTGIHRGADADAGNGIDPTPDKKHPGLKYQIMVCTRCLLMPADLKPDHVTNTTSSYEDGVFYVTPHADTCIRIGGSR